MVDSPVMPGPKAVIKDIAERLKDRFDRTPPPAEPEEMPEHYLPGIGKGEFERIGREFVDLFVRIGELRPDARILDVGCGLGRMVKPLQDHLAEGGSYEGFDVVRDIIRWNTRNITTFDPRFRFKFVNVYNSSYNPNGRCKPESFRFPYRDGGFDFVFATSVFTHLLEGSVENYLKECARVLAPGGRLFATFFLLDKTSVELINEKKSDIDFRYTWKLGLLMSPEAPEDAVAYDAEWVYDRIEGYGLKVHKPPHFGFWSGRESGLSYQDILLADKT